MKLRVGGYLDRSTRVSPLRSDRSQQATAQQGLKLALWITCRDSQCPGV